ncbi:hypothetical protein [uncultured Tenacibaculum sp.]|uniref:hypothetical protein n=1 Tax=uncultured Tenacibaculum sp. TaxID=174713 RepID=UPI00261DB754|nr:hypothetical protein [uncultured Tenacibaculum sp.]
MNKDKIAMIFGIFVLALVVWRVISKEKELAENKMYGEAKIIDYYNVGGKKYIKYVFFVNNKKYVGKKNVFSFKCDNGVDGCVGQKFQVIYSSKDPDNNEIHLGKYNGSRPNRIRVYSPY